MVGKWLRLANFLIDTIVYTIILIIGLFLFKNTIAIENVKWASFILYVLYYFLFEYFKGQTIGKMITKTEVVSFAEGHKYDAIKIAFRSVVRIIPFDVLSYLFSSRGLHDRVSMTILRQKK